MSTALGTLAVLALLVTPAAAQLPGTSTHCADTPTSVSYLFTAPLVVRTEAAESGELIAYGQPGEVAMVLCVIPGWMRVNLLAERGNLKGWVKGEGPRENLIASPWLDVRLTLGKMRAKAWPDETKWDIARRVVRIGFTREQVELALGRPLAQASEETAAGRTDVWTYPGQSIVFTDDTVSAIRRVTR